MKNLFFALLLFTFTASAQHGIFYGKDGTEAHLCVKGDIAYIYDGDGEPLFQGSTFEIQHRSDPDSCTTIIVAKELPRKQPLPPITHPDNIQLNSPKEQFTIFFSKSADVLLITDASGKTFSYNGRK